MDYGKELRAFNEHTKEARAREERAITRTRGEEEYMQELRRAQAARGLAEGAEGAAVGLFYLQDRQDRTATNDHEYTKEVMQRLWTDTQAESATVEAWPHDYNTQAHGLIFHERQRALWQSTHTRLKSMHLERMLARHGGDLECQEVKDAWEEYDRARDAEAVAYERYKKALFDA
jgi:hypothetical protein